MLKNYTVIFDARQSTSMHSAS